MTLLLDEAAVTGLISVDDALAGVRAAFVAQGQKRLHNLPRVLLRHGSQTVRITAAIADAPGYYGVKVSSRAVFGSSAGRVMSLFEKDSGRLCAMVQVFALGALRTAAVSALSAECMAIADATSLALIGTGRQAGAQLEAVVRVRPITRVRVVGRDPVRRRSFVEGARRPGLDVEAVDDVGEAVSDADIVITATSAEEPILLGDWLQPGTHVIAVGANDEARRELDDQVVARAAVIATDEPAQARYEAADLMHPISQGLVEWGDIRGLDELLIGTAPGRIADDDITLFKSIGTATGDLVLASMAYEAALERGTGVRLPELSGNIG